MPLKDFGNYLESVKNVPSKHKRFYVQWAMRFIEFSKKQPGLFLPDKLIEPFLLEFGKGCEQWQIDQAREAINLYCYFLNMVSSQKVKTEQVSIDDWKTAGDRMVRMLRLKQRAYRTEQTYRTGYAIFIGSSDLLHRMC